MKIEINTREHLSLHGHVNRDLHVSNPWFTGTSAVRTFTLAELLGTKLRALYQRKKGQDLLDLDIGLRRPDAAPEEVLEAFRHYLSPHSVSRAQFEANMATKLTDTLFLGDTGPLVPTGVVDDAAASWKRVHETLVTRLGDPWKGEGA